MIAPALALAAFSLRLALLTLGLAGLLASALCRAAEPPMAAVQRKDLASVRQQWSQRCEPTAGGTRVAGDQHAAVRDSRSAPPVVQMRNVDFRITGDIGFHVHQLTAQLVPHTPGQPVDMDDPSQFDIRILGGEVTVPKASLDALFNTYLLDYAPRSLNALSLTPGDGVLDVAGGLKLRNHFPGVWLPFGMRGTLALKESRYLVYTPTDLGVMGVQTLGLLKSMGLQLAGLAPLDRSGAKLDGDTMVLDQTTVFPPPRLTGEMKTARVTPDGLVLGEARVKGSGAGMEIPDGATLHDGSWHYRTTLPPLPLLRLGRTPEAGDYQLCIDRQCRPMSDWLGPPRAEQPAVELWSCLPPA
jgi:hypothetical protein